MKSSPPLFYDGIAMPTAIVAECKAWIDGEYDPDERKPKPCDHLLKKAVLDDSEGCTRCGVTKPPQGTP